MSNNIIVLSNILAIILSEESIGFELAIIDNYEVGGWIIGTSHGIGQIAEFLKCLNGYLSEPRSYPFLFGYSFFKGVPLNVMFRELRNW